MKTKLFTEAIDLSEARLDSAERVLRNVTLIRAGLSKNRRYYPETVLEKAAGLFEGVKAYNDHSPFGHRPTDITGWYTNVRYESGRLLADRHFTRTQSGCDVMTLAEDIVNKRAPASLSGLSIAVVGTGQEREFEDGAMGIEVESIVAAHSVDDVTEPAAGGSYLAAGGGDALAEKLLAALDYEDWQAARPEYVERLKKEWKQTRQDEALKAAKAEAEQLRAACERAEQAVADLTAERDAAVAGEAAARRELTVVEALYTTPGIPAAWRDDLREKLLGATPEQWQGIFERERKKARTAPRPRVPVSGAEAQERPPAPSPAPTMAVLPREGETMTDWAARMATIEE